jgi:UPF0042 nucleotide-binding protein
MTASDIHPAASDSLTLHGTPDKQRILLVTGVLGAGKTTALRVLEDLGWETIDNFPIRLLERLLDTSRKITDWARPGHRLRSRTRGLIPNR